ncbi:MAG: type II toxin-antitoxin system RelE/ParE family toxin [Gammaproteobacteria bacterium]|nr:type II toxin-antitoxin system RelE/ParE family toxin [Gammaproteobacteria bacterium]
MISSFADKLTAAVYQGLSVRRLPPDIAKRAREKLIMLHHVKHLNQLRIPPSNHLEALKGNRKGQWSIRINRQWRVCFEWHDGDACNVEIVDYH